MRFAILILLVTFAAAIFFAVVQIVFRTSGGGDIGGGLGAGADGGIYRSTNGGAEFAQNAKGDEGLDFSRFDVFDIKEDFSHSGTWWIATEGKGIVRSENQGESWQAVWGEEKLLERSVVRSFAQQSADTWILALDADNRGRIWKTDDRGKTFRETYSAAKDKVFITRIAVPRQDTKIVLAGLSDGLLIGSSDSGETWTSLNQFQGAVSELIIAPSDPSVVFVSIDRVGALVSRDRGATWEEPGQKGLNFSIDNPIGGQGNLQMFQGSRLIYSIAIHPNDANRILFASTSGLLVTSDGGTIWSQLPIPLRPESLPLRSVLYDPISPDTIYVTGGDGFYTSFDRGENWRVTRFTIRPKLTRIGVSASDRNIILVGTGE